MTMIKNRNRTIRIWRAVLSALICIAIAVCLVSFMKYYNALNESLRDERALYVNEITGQLTRSITAKREWLISRIGSSAASLEQSDVASFAEANKLFAFKNAENYTVLLVGDTGATYTLDGETAQIRNFDILSSTLEGDGPQYHFDKSSDGVDYWVFSSTIEPRMIDSVRVVAIYEIYNVAQFHDDLLLGLFGDDGYTYIVDPDAGVQLGPKIDVDFIGYNLVASLRNAGIGDADADRLAADIKQQKGDSLFAGFNGTDWAVQCAPLADSDEMVVVIAPIAATSLETTKALQYTLFAIVGVIFGLAILVLSIIISNARAAKLRDRQMYELELKNRVASTKNDFLAKMSHDIRTPLNAIIGMNYIATKQVDDKAPVMDCLKQIDTSAKYLLGILNDILDMSKIESGKMELRNGVFDGNEIIEAVMSVSRKQAAEKGVEFRVNIDNRLSDAYIGDKQRLAQILMNLTNNAVKYTDRGGKINVSFTLEERGETKDKTRLCVTDTGVGMTDEYMKNLFVPFTQDSSNDINSAGGSGLGLSIVKTFVDMMGGTITVKSKRGVGSSFDVVIELERAARPGDADDRTDKNADESSLEGKRVLLVEDNEVNLMIAQRILSRFGLIVETATNGAIALEMFTGSEPEYYDIVITDIKMPEMNGYEFTEAMRALDRPDAREIPILAMSANVFDDDIRESLMHGMNAHLKKPVDVDELRSALHRYLGGGE